MNEKWEFAFVSGLVFTSYSKRIWQGVCILYLFENKLFSQTGNFSTLRLLFGWSFFFRVNWVCRVERSEMRNNVSNRSTRQNAFIISNPVVNLFADQLPPFFSQLGSFLFQVISSKLVSKGTIFLQKALIKYEAWSFLIGIVSKFLQVFISESF